MMGLWDAYLRTFIALNSLPDSYTHCSVAKIDPLTVVTIDPDRLQYIVEGSVYPEQTRHANSFPMPKFQHAGKVTGGNWDAPVHRFDDSTLYQGFKAHFQEDRPWAETEFFQDVTTYLENGVGMWGCHTREEFQTRCSTLDALYESIDSNGYFSQRQLNRRSTPPMEDARTTSRTKQVIYDEITACVGRDGRLLFFDGRNRLAITKLLGLPSIPVWIMVRHPRWQQTREAVAAGDIPIQQLPERLRNHPDLHGLW